MSLPSIKVLFALVIVVSNWVIVGIWDAAELVVIYCVLLGLDVVESVVMLVKFD